MAKKKKQKNFKEVLYTDITTHSLLAMAIFGLVVSGFATTLLGAQFVVAYGNVLGQSDDAAAVVVAMDNVIGSSNTDSHRPMPAMGGVMQKIEDHMASSSMPGQTGSPSVVCKPLQIVRTLVRGSVGDDVKQLQQNLIQQGLLASSSATGFFGALTERAVGAWQMQAGIASSSDPDHNSGVGMVGPRTRALLMKCLVQMGDHGQGQNQNGNPPKPPMATSTATTTPH